MPYDDDWSRLFESERQLLLDAISPYVRGGIEHVGSTAVRGLVAKPVIDIMVGVADLASSQPALKRLERLQYQYAPYRPSEMHWLCKPSPQLRTHHLHLIPFQSKVWVERLAFRDYLRSHPDVAAQYGELKLALSEQFRSDREAYTDAKGPFIERVVALALPEVSRAANNRLQRAAGHETPTREGQRAAVSHVSIVPFSPAHTDDLIDLWRASFEAAVGVAEPHTVEQQRDYLLGTVVPNNRVLVALADGRVVGFMAASSDRIDQLYVHLDHQRQGIGALLLQWAKDNSLGHLSLFTFECNHRAQRFYEARGFRVAGRGFEVHWQLADIRYEWSREPEN